MNDNGNSRTTALTRAEAEQAVRRCSREELAILRTLQPREIALMLEAKFYADALILDGEQ